MRLTQAFVHGKQVKWYPTVIWNEITPETASQQAWQDFHADVLAVLLAGLPQEADNKLRMDKLVEMADAITELRFKV